MSLSQMVQMRSLKRTVMTEGKTPGQRVAVHQFDREVSNQFPERGKRTDRKMASLLAKINKS